MKISVRIYLGLAFALAGLGLYLWVARHSPYMGFGEMLANLDGYIIKEPLFSAIVLIAAGMGLTGLALAALGVADEVRTSPSSPIFRAEPTALGVGGRSGTRATWDSVAQSIAQASPEAASAIIPTILTFREGKPDWSTVLSMLEVSQ